MPAETIKFELYLRGDNTENWKNSLIKLLVGSSKLRVMSVDYAAQDTQPEIQPPKPEPRTYQLEPSAIGYTVSSALGSNRLPSNH